MSGLGQALTSAGWTQKALAKKLGVSTAAVNHWVKGNAPVPKSRLVDIERLLGAPADTLMADYEVMLAEARTPLGFAVLWALVGVEGEMVGTPVRGARRLKRRVLLLSREIGGTRQELEQALFGRGWLTAEDLNTLGRLTGFDARRFAEHCGALPSEAMRVQLCLEVLAEQQPTFAELQSELKQMRTDFMNEGLVRGGAVNLVSTVGESEDISWWLAGEDAPEFSVRGVYDNVIEGRFKSIPEDEELNDV